jgi:hypothetical protein
MKKSWIITGLIAIILLLPSVTAACGPAPVSAGLGQQFMLYAGKTAVITGEKLKIVFQEVTEDTRCPYGVECPTAGNAKCMMLITYSNSQTSMTFTQEGTDDNFIDFNVFKITYQLQPYPVSTDKIKAGDYRLRITVTRQGP